MKKRQAGRPNLYDKKMVDYRVSVPEEWKKKLLEIGPTKVRSVLVGLINLEERIKSEKIQ